LQKSNRQRCTSGLWILQSRRSARISAHSQREGGESKLYGNQGKEKNNHDNFAHFSDEGNEGRAPKGEEKVTEPNRGAATFQGAALHGDVSVNGVESVWAVLKRGIYGTFHHISASHTGRYVNEFAFRLNDGNVRTHTTKRLESLIAGTARRRLTYKRLVAK